jgi:predicted RNase H-like nuclease (RuvC/YqgF family)
MFNRKDKDKEEQEKLGRTIANLSDQVGALQQQLNQKNKQIEDLLKQVQQAQAQVASGKGAQAAQEQANKATQDALRDAQKQMQDLEKQIGALAKAKQEAEAAAQSAMSQPKAPSTIGQAASQAAGHVTNAAQAATGGLAIGVTAYVQNAGGKNLRRRSAPGLNSNILDGLAPGTQMTLLEGPFTADGYTWWRMRAADGREGWVAGEELVTRPE